MENRVIILHKVSDAEHCVKNRLHVGARLFSTHTAVDVYLKEEYGVACNCLSSLFGIDETTAIKNYSSDLADKVLKSLDDKISPLLNNVTGFGMRYFWPLYSYIGKFRLSGYIYFRQALDKVMNECKGAEIIVYNQVFDNFLTTATDTKYFLDLFFPGLDSEVISSGDTGDTNNKTVIKDLYHKLDIGKISRYTRGKLDDGLAYLKTFSFSKDKATLLLYEPLYDLKFLRKRLGKHNLLYFKNEKCLFSGADPVKKEPKFDISFLEKCFSQFEENDPAIKIFLKDIKEDFCGRIGDSLRVLAIVDKLNDKYPITLGIWGNPAISGQKALVFEYLRSRGIKVLGAQHGCSYGDQFEPWHFDSDFKRCDFYVSYGFEYADLVRLYPGNQIDTEILPYGSARLNDRIAEGKSANIGVLFPLARNASIFQSGVKIPVHELTERQVKILNFLNSLNGVVAYVKPSTGSNYRNCSIIPMLKRLKKIKVIDYMSLELFLTKLTPRVVILDCPASPLLEVIHLDVEIFFMHNPLAPFEKEALEKLKKRVYYCEDTDELISKLGLFLEGKLGHKRDDEYYNHYVYKKDTKEMILTKVDTVTANRKAGVN